MYVLSGVVKLILISLPQNLAYIICIYAFNKKKIDGKNFWKAMIISMAAIFWIRLLPISYGVPTLICVVVLIILGVYLLKFPIYRTILSVLFVFIVSALLELVTFKVMTLYIGEDGLIKVLDNGFNCSLAGFPSSILLLVVTLIIYLLSTRHVKCTDDSRSK